MKVISGGQTGVDQAALRAARACGLNTGGWAPKGWVTEDGRSPWLAGYGLREMPTASYSARTRKNVQEADATLILTQRHGELSGGTYLTNMICFDETRKTGKCYHVHRLDHEHALEIVLDFMTRHFSGSVLNVAGPRESKSPGIGEKAEAFLKEVFTLLVGNEDHRP